MSNNSTVVDFVENYFSNELSTALIEHIGALDRDKVLSFYDLFWEQSDSFFNTTRTDLFPSPLIGVCANAIDYRLTDYDLITITDMKEKVDPVIENIKRFLVYYRTVRVPISDIEYQVVQNNREPFESGLLQNFVYFLLRLKPLITAGYINLIPVKKPMKEINAVIGKNNLDLMERLHDPELYLSGPLGISDGAIILSDLAYCKYLNADFVTNRLDTWKNLRALIDFSGFTPLNIPLNEQGFICTTDEITLPQIDNLTNDDIITLRESSIDFHEWYNLTREIMAEVQSLDLASSSIKDNFLKIANRHTFSKAEKIKKEIKQTSLANHIKGAGIKSIQAYASLKIAEPLLKNPLIMEDELFKIVASSLIGLTELVKFKFTKKSKVAFIQHLSLFSPKQ